jgi:hypothetical protein
VRALELDRPAEPLEQRTIGRAVVVNLDLRAPFRPRVIDPDDHVFRVEREGLTVAGVRAFQQAVIWDELSYKLVFVLDFGMKTRHYLSGTSTPRIFAAVSLTS